MSWIEANIPLSIPLMIIGIALMLLGVAFVVAMICGFVMHRRLKVKQAQKCKCPDDIWRHGKVMAMITDMWGEVLEKYVECIREKSGVEKIDWHWMGGRALIRALGTPEELKRIDEVMFWRCLHEGSLQGLPCQSCCGYFPGGEYHWTTQGGDAAIFIVAAIRDAREEQTA